MDSPPDRLLAAAVLREEAESHGFTRFGIAAVEQPEHFDRFERWIATGRNAGMRYLADTLEARRTPVTLLPGARSVVCLAAPYSGAPYDAADGSRMARYARGPDYHGTLRGQALKVAARARERLGGRGTFRICVDSTPLAERSFAAAAGLGWIGKNGCLIAPDQGSYLLLAEILTDLDLPADAPVASQCGSCVRCLESCPTGAFLEPGLLDAGRCIAYWTIEHRGAIPDGWKERLAEHVFGCDVCQEVCPWNAPLGGLAADAPPTRAEILAMGKGAWRRRFGKTAVNRAARRGLQRNAAVSAGARGDSACLPALRQTSGVSEPGLRDASDWAEKRLRRLPL